MSDKVKVDTPDIEVDPLPKCFHMHTSLDLATGRMICQRCGQVFVPVSEMDEAIAALRPFTRAADFFEHVHDYTYFEPDENSLRNYSNTHTNQAINPIDGLKVRHFRRAADIVEKSDGNK